MVLHPISSHCCMNVTVSRVVDRVGIVCVVSILDNLRIESVIISVSPKSVRNHTMMFRDRTSRSTFGMKATQLTAARATKAGCHASRPTLLMAQLASTLQTSANLTR